MSNIDNPAYIKSVGSATEWVIVLLCFAYPISAVSSLFLQIPSTGFNMLYRTLALIIASFVITQGFRLPTYRGGAILIFFLLIYFFRLLIDTGIYNVYYDSSMLEIFGFFLGSIFIPVLAIARGVSSINRERLIKKAFIFLIIANTMSFIAVLWQNKFQISLELFLQRAEVVGLNENDHILNSISYGVYGGYLFLISMSFPLFFDKNEQVRKFWVYFGLSLGLLNLLMGASRGPILMVVISMVFALYCYHINAQKTMKHFLKVIMLSLITILGIAFLVNYYIQKQMKLAGIDRLVNFSGQIKSGEKEIRDYLFEEAWSMFLNYPLLGDQFVLRSTGGYPHNIFLEVLMALGLIGFVIFSILIINLLKKLQSFRKYDRCFIVFVILFLLSFGLTFTSGNIYQNVEFWNLCGLIVFYPKK